MVWQKPATDDDLETEPMTTLPHIFKRIRLNLARSKEFPQGSSKHGYEFVAPLDAAGHIDVEAWRKHREHCRVRRFWEGEDDQIGRLEHKAGGPRGRWVFDYDPRTGRRRSRLPLRKPCVPPGEYVSIRGEDGEMHTFQVMSVTPAT